MPYTSVPGAAASQRPELLLATSVSPALRAALEARFRIADAPGPGVRALVGGGTLRLDAARLDALPALEIVAIHGVGHDGIDLDAVRARGVRVTLTPDVLTDDVADLAIGLLLAVERRIAANDRAVRAGEWSVPLARRVSGRRIGLYGMGRIGAAIARRAAPFSAAIAYTSRTPRPALPWRYEPDLVRLAEQSDVLVVAAAASEENRNAVDGDVLDALGAEGVLVNVARGSIVDQDALVAALAADRLRGAGLDVFADEPAVPDALRAMDRVVLSPHQGSATVETRAQMADLVLANLDAHFAGRPLPTPLA